MDMAETPRIKFLKALSFKRHKNNEDEFTPMSPGKRSNVWFKESPKSADGDNCFSNVTCSNRNGVLPKLNYFQRLLSGYPDHASYDLMIGDELSSTSVVAFVHIFQVHIINSVLEILREIETGRNFKGSVFGSRFIVISFEKNVSFDFACNELDNCLNVLINRVDGLTLQYTIHSGEEWCSGVMPKIPSMRIPQTPTLDSFYMLCEKDRNSTFCIVSGNWIGNANLRLMSSSKFEELEPIHSQLLYKNEPWLWDIVNLFSQAYHCRVGVYKIVNFLHKDCLAQIVTDFPSRPFLIN